jgi:hypothetical protein
MDKILNNQDTANLERVIEKNQHYLDSASQDLQGKILGGASLEKAPASVLKDVLKLYQDMLSRVLEMEAVQRLLNHRLRQSPAKDPKRQKLIADLNAQIAALSARLDAVDASGPDVVRGKTGKVPAPARTSSDRWLRIEQDSLAFTINARLLDELEYEAPPQPGGPVRMVQKSGRGFTLFTLRGPASALDALYPCVRLRQHDIIERFSATEIRGVMTHLRQTATGDIKHIFERLLTSRFADVKCVLSGLPSPDQLDEHFLEYLERMVDKMRPGDILTIDIGSQA